MRGLIPAVNSSELRKKRQQRETIQTFFTGRPVEQKYTEVRAMKVLSKVARRRWRNQQKRWLLQRPTLSSMGKMLLLCSLLVVLSACTNYFAAPTQTGTPSTNTISSPVTTTPIVSPTTAKPVLPTI